MKGKRALKFRQHLLPFTIAERIGFVTTQQKKSVLFGIVIGKCQVSDDAESGHSSRVIFKKNPIRHLTLFVVLPDFPLLYEDR
ncbi:hypothetical protein AVEN_61975-1 [Araneus ventricosus]|uniref:Uncharacterized protein n=1 Tax=Araneus ventricosus TaxID=182803 RepID=A0A4Y2VJS2_ARAVE|nr:hypothetical protein AVEN_61975-1 [Araneus ventricosus]